MSLEGHHQCLLVPAVQLVEHHQAAAVCVCVCIVNVVVRFNCSKISVIIEAISSGRVYVYIITYITAT